MFSILFGLFLLFSLPGFEKVNASTFNELTGCNLTADQKKYYSDNFKSELAKRNLEEFIWKDGRKLYINKEFTINNCLPLYGSHKDVQSYGKDRQRRDQYGNYKFLGYNAGKLPVLNAQYYELEMQHDLLNKRN